MPRITKLDNARKLTPLEEDVFLSLSNTLYDAIRDRLGLSEDRTDALVHFMIRAGETWLEEGR